jgi:hypothetical protein
MLPVFGSYAVAAQRDLQVRLDLDGTWQFRLDPKNEGIMQRWFTGDVAYPDTIKVPGNWQAQGFGPGRGHLRHDYQGKAWYRRSAAVPAQWAGRRIWIYLGGVTNTADVYVNGVKVGFVEGFAVPYEFDVTEAVRPGAENLIVCCVDSTGPAPGGLFNFIGRWGGLYRGVHLEARSVPSIDDVFVIPDVRNKTAGVQVTLGRAAGGPAREGSVEVRVVPNGGGPAREGHGTVAFTDGRRESEPVKIDVAMPRAHLWSPEDPFLYRVEVARVADGKVIDRVKDRFGMRQFSVGPVGTLLLNGRPYFVRGIGDDTVEVFTGTQYPDKQIYIDRLRQIKRYGFNGVRFLGNTPIPEYFEAADEVGVLVMAEGHIYHKPKEVIPLLKKDVARIAKANRNHPSWYIWSSGNEFFECQGPAPERDWIDYIRYAHDTFKRIDPTRFFVASDGADVFPTDIITQAGKFYRAGPAVVSEQPFCGLIGEVAYFRRALRDDELSKTADRSLAAGDYARVIQFLRPSGYWRFDETAPGRVLDSSGNHRHGIHDATVKASDLARPGALDSPGSSRAIHTDPASRGVLLKNVAGAAFAPGNDPFSVSLWIKPDGFREGDYGTPFAYGAADPGSALLVSEDGAMGTGKVRLGRYGEDFLVSEHTLLAGRWNHIGITYDSRQLKLYLNGKFDKGQTIKLTTVPADGRIGGCVTSPAPNVQMYRQRPHIWHEFPNTYVGPVPDLAIVDKWTGVYQDPDCIRHARRQIAGLGLLEPLSGHSPALGGFLLRVPQRCFRGGAALGGVGRLRLLVDDGLREIDERYGIDPHRPAAEPQLVLASRLAPEIVEALIRGKPVVLLAEQGALAHPGGFSFWPQWIRSTGTVIEEHPALAPFPHGGFCDLQFVRLFEGGLETLPMTDKRSLACEKFVPIAWGLCQDYDPDRRLDWADTRNRWKIFRHGILCEGRVGGGRLVICCLRVLRGIQRQRPEAGYLLDCLIDYALSPRFAPSTAPMAPDELPQVLTINRAGPP